MVTPVLPKAQYPIADNGLRGPQRTEVFPTREWLDFLRDLLGRVNDDEALAAEISALIARIVALEGTQINGPQSVQVFGSISQGLVTLMLRGDEPLPSPLFYYGTGPTGTKGWWPAASLVAYLVDENGDYLVDENGNFLISADITADLFAIVETTPGLLAHTGVGTWESRTLTEGAGIDITNGGGVAGNPTVAHADTSSVADLTSNNSGTVVIQDVTITFDTFGHVLTATVGTVDVAAALSGTFEPAIAAGTTSQFWRGDKTFTNTLTGGLILSMGTASTNPLAVSGDLTGNGRIFSFINTNTGTGSSLVYQFTAGTGGTHTMGAFAPEYTIVAAFTGRMVFEGLGAGVMISAMSATATIDFSASNAAGRTLRWRIENDGDFVPGADNSYAIGTAVLRPSVTHTMELRTYGAVYDAGVRTPAQFTANTDNFTVQSTDRILRLSSDAPRNFTGMTGGASGRRMTLSNVGAQDIVLIHDATSTAANRFFCPSSANVTLGANDTLETWYDATSSRWRVHGL